MTSVKEAEQLYVVISRINDAAPSNESNAMELFEQHRAYFEDLLDRKLLLGSGPAKDENGQRYGGAILILRAKNFDEAREIAAQEPYCREGKRTFEVIPWQRKVIGE